MKRTTSLSIIAFALLVLLAPLVLFFVNSRNKMIEFRDKRTKVNIVLLKDAVIIFKEDTGRYPTEEEGLDALIEEPANVTDWQVGGYLQTTDLPKDGWGNDFIYKLTPNDKMPFIIISYGRDGKEGGKGYNQDITSDNLHNPDSAE